MQNVEHPNRDDTGKFLSILSRTPWCKDVLVEISRRGSCERADLYHLLKTGGARSAQVAHETVDRYLTLLEKAELIEQAGDTVRITHRGAAAAKTLDSRPTAVPARELGPSAPHSERAGPTDERVGSLIGRIAAKKIVAERLRATVERPNRFRKYATTLVVVASVLILLGWNYVGAIPFGGSQYRFADVERGDMKVFTLATGRIEAINAVEVSSQLSGQVVALHANFNDEVTAGSPLAKLDDKSFQAAVAEAQAQHAHAKASYDSAAAKTAGAEARYEESRQAFERKQTLAKKGSISAQEIDQAQAKLATAESERDAARAEEATEKAAIDMAAAALRKAQIALDRTVVRSPIDGIVIRRSVELGQTVAVSMEAPTLFTITRDLAEMLVHARVDEADIGQIKAGQKTSFSVDAYPGRIFSGQVVEVHRAPETVQNVVTYKVVITAQNPDLALLPGMTALVRIATVERSDALLVPNAALRFEPEPGATSSSRDETGPEVTGEHAHVWVHDGYGGLSRADIGVGASDGNMTEVVSGPLSEGEALAVGKRAANSERTFFGIRLGF